MTSAVRKATASLRGKKKERSQPAKRAKLGLLEKHKDYVQRARNFHAKEKRILALQAKADMRNQDEFYFKMQKGGTKGGIAELKKMQRGLNMDTVKILKGQDLGYVTMKATAECVFVLFSLPPPPATCPRARSSLRAAVDRVAPLLLLTLLCATVARLDRKVKVDKMSANLQFVGVAKPKSHRTSSHLVLSLPQPHAQPRVLSESGGIDGPAAACFLQSSSLTHRRRQTTSTRPSTSTRRRNLSTATLTALQMISSRRPR